MEPIRPDEDELRSRSVPETAPKSSRERPVEKADKANKTPKKSTPAKTPESVSRDNDGAGKRSRGVGLLFALLVVAIALGAGLGFQQERRIQALEGQLEEADYWARQSKLALARFEGALSETGESLEETGASMGERLDAVDGEIRKLWVLANERNRQQLENLQAELEGLQSGLAGQVERVGGVESTLDKQRERLTADMAGLGERLDEQGEALAGQLAGLAEQVGSVDGLVDSRLQRFLQERRLADEEVASRLAALERQVSQQAGSAELTQVRNRLTELEQTVKSIDASRAQLTSRLVGLSEELARLRQGGGGQ